MFENRAACTLGFTRLDERVASLLPCAFGLEEQVLAVVCASVPNSSSEYPPFLESLGWVCPHWGLHRPLGDFNAHMGNDSETWRGVIGRNGLPDKQ